MMYTTCAVSLKPGLAQERDVLKVPRTWIVHVERSASSSAFWTALRASTASRHEWFRAATTVRRKATIDGIVIGGVVGDEPGCGGIVATGGGGGVIGSSPRLLQVWGLLSS